MGRWNCSAMARASGPPAASRRKKPLSSRTRRANWRMAASSSTKSTVSGAAAGAGGGDAGKHMRAEKQSVRERQRRVEVEERGRDGDGAPVGHGAFGVGHEVDQDAFELARDQAHLARTRVQAQDELVVAR